MCACPCHTAAHATCQVPGGCCSGAVRRAYGQQEFKECATCRATVRIVNLKSVSGINELRRLMDHTGLRFAGPQLVCSDCAELAVW